MGRQLVLFDLDGTLIDGSSERTFWRYLAARGYQTPRHLRRFAAALWRDGRALRRHAWRVNKSYLAGFSCADVERLAADFVSLRLTRAVHQPALARLRLHQAYGDTVVLLTGTLQPIADALAYAWDVEHVCATICAARDGEYCAEPPLRHPFGSDKLEGGIREWKAAGNEITASTQASTESRWGGSDAVAADRHRLRSQVGSRYSMRTGRLTTNLGSRWPKTLDLWFTGEGWARASSTENQRSIGLKCAAVFALRPLLRNCARRSAS